MKTILTLLLSIFITNTVFSQWELVEGTNAQWNILEFELSDDYLFISYFDQETDERDFVRIDMRDGSKKTMLNPDSEPFTQNGLKRMASINKHILYSDDNITFVSHDYGDTWNTTNLHFSTGLQYMASDGIFFVGTKRTLYKSENFGSYFKEVYYEWFYTTASPKPLLLKDSIVYFSQKRGLVSIHIDGETLTTHDENSRATSLLYVGNRFISTPNSTDLYQSFDDGNTWTLLNKEPFGSDEFIVDLIYDEGLIYAVVCYGEFQVSSDLGGSFYSMSEGLPTPNCIKKLEKNENDLYLSTDNGLYKRSRSNFDFPTDIDDYKPNSNNLSVFPNPTHGYFSLPNIQNEKIVIFNKEGQKVNFSSFKEGDSLQINIEDKPKGVYILQIHRDNGTILTKKIMKLN